ncbi:MAG: hypothetical protein SVU32_09455 [Candidatus Nanohaloarchaea archaeon]|nr:hypothetical protein [Candidatus Nanohaloarchaea archaeon]
MRNIKTYRYIFAAVLTVLIFLLGILFSNFVDDIRSSRIEESINENFVELESRQLQLAYLKEDVQSCNVLKTGLSTIISDYNQNLGRVQRFEKNSIFNKDRFNTLQRQLMLSGIRYWMFAEDLKERCPGYNATTALFFSREDGCEACGRVGKNLALLKNKYGKGLLVFTVTVGTNDPMITILEQQYNITEVPAVVINEERVLRQNLTVQGIEQRINATPRR